MSKEEWFRQFERLEAEHPEKSDEELSNMAQEALVDQISAKADQLVDEAKTEGPVILPLPKDRSAKSQAEFMVKQTTEYMKFLTRRLR